MQPAYNIIIDAKRNANLVTVAYEVSGNKKEQSLNIALVQPEATIAIKCGENGGRTLRHVNILRSLKTIVAADKGSISFEFPREINGGPLQLLAFTQNIKTLHITAAQQQSF